MSEIYGVTFPVPKSLMCRFFDEGKTVFIKPATVWKELKPKMPFIFYQSHQDSGFVGEAIIKNIIFSENPLTFFKKYGEKIFLTKEEVNFYLDDTSKWRYKKSRLSKKPWMAIELEKIIKYPIIKKPDHFIPVSGKYLRE